MPEKILSYSCESTDRRFNIIFGFPTLPKAPTLLKHSLFRRSLRLEKILSIAKKPKERDYRSRVDLVFVIKPIVPTRSLYDIVFTLTISQSRQSLCSILATEKNEYSHFGARGEIYTEKRRRRFELLYDTLSILVSFQSSLRLRTVAATI